MPELLRAARRAQLGAPSPNCHHKPGGRVTGRFWRHETGRVTVMPPRGGGVRKDARHEARAGATVTRGHGAGTVCDIHREQSGNYHF